MSSAWHFGTLRKGELLSLSTSSLSFVLNHRRSHWLGGGQGGKGDDDEEATQRNVAENREARRGSRASPEGIIDVIA